MSFIMVDIEADGPVPGLYSMVQLGAVLVETSLDKTFFGEFKPISENWQPEALAVTGLSRKETLSFPDAGDTIAKFSLWVSQVSRGRPIFIADNPGFDYAFVNYYCHKYLGGNPFGHTAYHLGSLYKGMVNNTYRTFKHLRKTSHTHNPVDDAMGNAEALLYMKYDLGLDINLK